jgi:hypothetical protein
MERKEFSIVVNVPKEKLWNTLWNDNTYREWTSVFAEGSKVETDWKKGSKVLFVDGTGSGMVSRIAENKPNEYLSIEHLGTIKNGVEDLDSPENKAWAGAQENYTLRSVNSGTELKVDMDITEEYADYFATTWPKALEKLKEVAERN